MPYRVREIQPTPNPNAAKFVLDKPISQGPTSFLSASQAVDHPLAAKLFSVEGVSSLLLLGDFITVNKTPDADWKTVSDRVKAILASA